MFRELNQKKKNIINLIIIWLIIEYCSLPVSALYSAPSKPISSITETVDTEDTEDTEIKDEIIIEVESKVESEIKETTSAPIEIIENTASSTATNSQITVESEVIDEYFDDAHIEGTYAVPSISTHFKSYTYYALLSKSSTQGKLQERAYTDENGLRKIGNCYLVAMGSYYSTTIGDKFRLTTDTGNVFDVMLCDAKADRHTDRLHMYTKFNHCMVEFYVDMPKLNRTVKKMGSVGVLPQFSGSIVKVESLGSYEW